ncbi:MAG: TonB-dependent receptor plug domain-containing protein, partial [Myxococcota bacterium]|nr:TonB-dependent receptor plug domain-containing protein [Myxococcota bacterium]
MHAYKTPAGLQHATEHVVIVLSVVCGCYASQSLAEPPAEPLSVPTVRVEGHRHVDDDAAPRTVITREQMADSMADLPEILEQSPGLRTTRLGGLGSYSTVSIRGSTSEQVLIFVDGIPLNSGEGGPVNLASLPLGPVDTVVVYRGISPVRFGGSAIGGVVSVHTRELDEPMVEVEGGGGHFGTRLARAFAGYGSDTWSLGASLDYFGSLGDFTFTDDNGTRFDASDDRKIARQNNHMDQVAALAKGHVSLGQDWALRALNLTTWQKSGLAGRANLQSKQTSLEQTRNLTSLRLEGLQLGNVVDFTVTGFLSWAETRLSDPLSEIGFGADESRDTNWAPGVTTLLNVPIAFDEDELWGMRLSVTGQYRYESFEPGSSSSAVVGKASIRHFAMVASEIGFQLEPLDTEVIGSLRWESTWSTLTQPSNTFSLQRDPPDQSGEEAITWRTALVQRSIPMTELTINVSSAVRFPSLYELFGNTGAVLGNPALKPEE